MMLDDDDDEPRGRRPPWLDNLSDWAALIATFVGLPLAFIQFYDANFTSAKQIYTSYLASAADQHAIINMPWEEASKTVPTADAYATVTSQLLFACEQLQAASAVPFVNINWHWKAWRGTCVRELQGYCGYLKAEWDDISLDYRKGLDRVVREAISDPENCTA